MACASASAALAATSTTYLGQGRQGGGLGNVHHVLLVVMPLRLLLRLHARPVRAHLLRLPSCKGQDEGATKQDGHSAPRLCARRLWARRLCALRIPPSSKRRRQGSGGRGHGHHRQH